MRKTLLILALVCLSRVAVTQPNTAFPNLLTGQTPFAHTTPSGWTLNSSENFELGSCQGTGTYCNGIFTTLQHHNDGNPADTHSMGCTYGNYSAGSLVCNSSTSWNRPLPVGTRQVYISFYEWVDSTFRMNDEMFLTRFWWNPGTGQPIFREAIFDYFQNATGDYNSTNATLLWNMQGQPYYQNKLPSNTIGDNTNFTITTGSWVQHEIYMLYSTVSGTIPISGTVTVSGSGHTYTRSSGSWINDGITVGASPHFTGFSNSLNNGDGSAGGGGSSYFVTAVTDTVMTVTDPDNFMVNEGPVSNLTYQIDRGDGAYAYYKNGTLVAFQNNMVSPGLVDFSTQATNLSILESYSKLIWRAHVNGNCETQSTGTYTGACAAGIGGTYSPGGCGFEQIPLGWNGSGLTQSVTGSGYNTHIDCDATWGGPMPTPPVFNRYIDDLIVLTKANSPTSTPVAAATLTATSDSCGQYQTVAFPKYAQFTLGSGTSATCGVAGTSGQGILHYFDLKNDPTALYDFGAADTGMFEHQWGIKNQDGTTRYNEVKEGPMAITVTESNNVRVKLTQAGAVRSVGLLSNTADCCMTMSKTYVFYRNGSATTGTGSSKVFTQTTINYNNADSQAPLTTVGTGTGINYYDKMGWWRISGETNNQSNPCPAPGSLGTFTLSPWNIIWPGAQLDNTLKTYILYAPVNANDTHATEFLPANPCTSPAATNPGPENTTSGQPQPGTIMLCNGATSTACASQSAAPLTVKANFLQIEQEQTCNFMSIGTQNYFLGGLRTYCALANQTFPANTPRSWTSVGFLGDNGVTSDGAATSYVTEYKSPPTITFLTGSVAAFDPVEGYWTMTAATNAVSFSANGVLHSPAFNISSFSSAAPTTITVGGVTQVKDTNYVAVKTDSTHLLLQVLADVASGTNIQILGSGGTTVTVSPKTATIPKSGTQQFTAIPSGATWSVNSGCVGAINSTTGIFTATTTAETCTVTATVGSVIDTGTVTVSAVTVTPSSVAMSVGGTQQFTSNFPVTWTKSGGNGSITSSGGLFSAGTLNCSCTITATAVNGASTGTATATVTGQITNLPLTISPTSWNYGTVTISTNADKVFTITNPGTGTNTISANAITAGGTQYSLNATTCGGTLAGGASCTDTVRFNSAVAGTWAGNLQVLDSAGGTNNVPLTATVAAGTTVTVNPTTATLPYSGVQQFTANVAVTWTKTCTGGGGAITSTGFFTAPAAATTCTVTATHTSGATGQANVTVNQLSVNPVAVTLQINSKQQFTANFASTWAITSGTCTISAGGLLTAPTTNTSCIVRATAQNGGSTATASVSVVGAPSSTPGTQMNPTLFDAGTVR
jgi:hypothetical protein